MKEDDVGSGRRASELVPTLLPYNDHITFNSYTLNVDENYHAYLIRFRRREAQSSWCASLEDVHTHETLMFATERELLVYLLQILSERPGPSDASADVDTGTKS